MSGQQHPPGGPQSYAPNGAQYTQAQAVSNPPYYVPGPNANGAPAPYTQAVPNPQYNQTPSPPYNLNNPQNFGAKVPNNGPGPNAPYDQKSQYPATKINVIPPNAAASQQYMNSRCATGDHDILTIYGRWGIIAAIFCFPCGLLCLCCDKETKCERCYQTF